MVFRSQRKRLRVSPRISQNESLEEVGEFGAEESSDSDFQHSEANGLSQELVRPAEEIRIGGRAGARDAQTWDERYSSIAAQSGRVTSAKKTKEVLSWLRQALDKNGSRLLILAGPPGSGKSSAVLAAAMELRCSVVDWRAPATGTRGISMALLEDFRSFFVGGRYPALQCDENGEANEDFVADHKVLLVEDLPLSTTDIFQKRTMLQQIFADAVRFAPHPTVVVLSDSEKGIARTARLLLGSDLLESPFVATIKVPAITDIMMRRRLREVLSIEGLSVPQDQLDEVISWAHGDIRAALNGLQLSAKVEGRNDSLSELAKNYPQPKRNSKRKRCKPLNNIPVLSGIGQDTTLGTYHAVSKILNNKRKEDGESKYIAEDILEDARADPASFLAFLHHNYPEFFGGMDDVVAVLDCLSGSDCLLPWRQDDVARSGLYDCAASVATRGFLLHNTHPIRTGWRPIRGPDSYEVAKESREHVGKAQQRFAQVLAPGVYTRSTLCETVPFAEQITRSTIKQWGVFGIGNATARTPIADAAEIAMVDMEAAHQNGSSANFSTPNHIDAVEYPVRDDVVEGIEDWDDKGEW